MRAVLSFIILLLAFSAVAAQEHTVSDWQVFRSEADGFAIEMPGTPKVNSRDLGGGATQKFFVVEIGQEAYLASVIQLPAGRGPANPDEAYFTTLMKAYCDGSGTKLRSSRMTTWAGRTAMEGIADSDSGTHLIDMTAAGDRLYLVVTAVAKADEGGPKATRMRDSFKLLGN